MEFKIKDIREQRGLTQSQLADKSSVSRNLIARLESGDLKSTSTNTLVKLASALETSVDSLFFEPKV